MVDDILSGIKESIAACREFNAEAKKLDKELGTLKFHEMSIALSEMMSQTGLTADQAVEAIGVLGAEGLELVKADKPC